MSVAFAVLIGMVILLSVQVGYLFYMKRELQKAADLAALSAVQVLAPSGAVAGCQPGQPVAVAARRSAVDNVPGFVDPLAAGDVSVQCLYWDPTRPDPSGKHVFTPNAAAGERANAVRVHIATTLSSLIPSVLDGWTGGTRVQVEAVASNTAPTAAFSVESRLLRLASDGLLGKLLASLGATPAQLDVLDSAGLVNLNITPSGLLQELGIPVSVLAGVGTPEQLAALPAITLGELLNASLAAAQRTSGTAQAQIGLLADIVNVMLDVAPLNIPIKPFGEGGLLDIGVATDAQAALQADIKVTDLLQTGLMIANGDNLIDLGLNVPILGVQSRVRVVEPPSIAVGGVGTRASTAGVRVYLRLNTSSIPVVGPVLNTLGTKVDLPLIVEVGQSDATLTGICEAPLAPDQARFDVRSSVANVCVGQFPSMGPGDEFFSTANACIEDEFTSVQRYPILNVLGLLPVSSRVTLPVFRAGDPVPVTLTEPDSPDSTKTVNATDLDLAELVRNVADTVILGLLADLTEQNAKIPAGQAKQFAERLVGSQGAGESVSAVVNRLNWSAEQIQNLNNRVINGGLLGLLGGTVTVVGNLLDTVAAVVADTVCVLHLTPNAIRSCRIDSVAALALTGTSALSGLINVVIALLQPLLDPISELLRQVLMLLGLNLGETDVSLLSVDCGKPRLVY